jgi:hypothetical protein
LISLLEHVLRTERERRLAVAMALHARLGGVSELAALGGDLLPLCIPSIMSPPIGTWAQLLDGLTRTAAGAGRALSVQGTRSLPDGGEGP